MGCVKMCLCHSGVCSWLLSCRGSVDPASLDILLTACVNSLSWNSFSKDDPPWGERGRHKAAAAVYLLFCWFFFFFLSAHHHLLKALHSRLSQERFVCIT